jgi:hypothetical protein
VPVARKLQEAQQAEYSPSNLFTKIGHNAVGPDPPVGIPESRHQLRMSGEKLGGELVGNETLDVQAPAGRVVYTQTMVRVLNHPRFTN